MSFPDGNYLLYDDDCGICTTFAQFFGRMLKGKTTVLPMHLDNVLEAGMQEIPGDYWKSFHMVKQGNWFTEGDAILQLAGTLPFGGILQKVAAFPPIYRFLIFFLRQMQSRRKMECRVDI